MPFIPTCSGFSIDTFEEKWSSRGLQFNLSNAGDYVYDVSGGGQGGEADSLPACVQAVRRNWRGTSKRHRVDCRRRLLPVPVASQHPASAPPARSKSCPP